MNSTARLTLYGVSARLAKRCVSLCLGIGVAADELFRVDEHLVVARSKGEDVLYVRTRHGLEFTRLPELWSRRLKRDVSYAVTTWKAVGGKPYNVAIKTRVAS